MTEYEIAAAVDAIEHQTDMLISDDDRLFLLVYLNIDWHTERELVFQ